MKKFTTLAVAASFAVAGVAGAQGVAQMSQAELITLLQAAQARLAQLEGNSTSCSTFSADLSVGSTGADVSALQTRLETAGSLVIPAGVQKGYFGPLTQAALASYQAANGIAPAVGYFGPITRAHFNTLCTTTASNNTGTTTTTTTSTSGLKGGAGSITVDSLSDYTLEEVGEGEDEVGVLAFEVEADDESDVEITSIKVEFVQNDGDASDKLDDYADSVQVMYKGEVVGKADADDFSENSDVYTKSISLDGVVIEAGDTEELTVAVTALNNLDSGDIATDDWDVDVLNVRFMDADGVVTTEDTDDEALDQSFDFTDFASSADLELKVSLGDDDINDAHVIDIDDTDDTENVELLSVELEAEGDSDILVKDFSVNFDSVGVDLEDAVSTVYLYVDGKKVGSESITKNTATPGTDETIEFDEVDFTIDAGDTVEVIVKAKVKSIDDGIVNGDTISAQVSATERAFIDAEDEEGEDVATGDMTGTAIGDAHGLFEEGIMVEFVSQSASAAPSGLAGVDDFGTFTIVFDVTAFDSDVYVDGSAITDEAGGATYQDIDATNIAATAVLDSTADDAANSTFKVDEGSTERFTLTISGSGDDVFASASLTSVLYALTAIDGDVLYTFNMDDFETDNVFLSGND